MRDPLPGRSRLGGCSASRSGSICCSRLRPGQHPARGLRPTAKHPTDALPEGAWIDSCVILTLLFLSVLVHEFGHCFGARFVGGDCQEILMWPLGGLAYVDVPHTPRANFITAAAGPAVNLFLCVVCVLLLLVADGTPHPAATAAGSRRPLLSAATVPRATSPLYTWSGEAVDTCCGTARRSCWPGCSGSTTSCSCSTSSWSASRWTAAGCSRRPVAALGYRQATLTAVFVGFVVVLRRRPLRHRGRTRCWRCACACSSTSSCKHQWMILETGGEDAVRLRFLAGLHQPGARRAAAAPPSARQSWWQRWLQQRAAKKIQRELEQREAEEQRMDELLEKIQRQGTRLPDRRGTALHEARQRPLSQSAVKRR